MPVDSDIRKWFLKQAHKKEASEGGQPMKTVVSSAGKEEDKSRFKKTSKYFKLKHDAEEAKPEAIEKVSKPEATEKASPAKRKQQNAEAKYSEEASGPSPKRPRGSVDATRGVEGKASVENVMDSGRSKGADKVAEDAKAVESTPPGGGGGGGRGRGRGRGASAPAADTSKESPASASRGRGGSGRGYFLQQRGPPPHKGQKEVPEGTEDCLASLTFVISGTLDSLEREEAEDLIKRHGGRVTTSVSKKTNFLLADEDIGGRKSEKAKELGISFLTEDGLFEMVRASNCSKSRSKEETARGKSRQKEAEAQSLKGNAEPPSSSVARVARTSISTSPLNQPVSGSVGMLSWTHKHQPRTSTEIIGNQSIVKQLHDWLQHWDEQHLHHGNKGKKRAGGSSSSSGVKKAVLLSGSPGIGKTTTARIISKELGFEALEVNASDSRGKADSKVGKGIGGSLANTIREMVNNESLTTGITNCNTSHKKSVLIMDEVDGMLGGDRGGIADLISSIKISRIPIICICNDRYSQKLKSLLTYCLPLNFRKPTKQQMAKRLQHIALAEGLHVDEIALEELAQEVNGDMRMALNQLQYMSLRSQVIKYDDMKKRLKSSAKDEDITPFGAVEKLMGFEGGRLSMNDRLDASMSDLDLVPLLIQENHLNYIPSLAGRDENGTARMDLVARTSSSIADGDIVNVQIRRHRQWQHAQMAAFVSSIIPAALMHGKRETFSQGERNFNRFPGWLGKNSSFGRKLRLLEDLHIHLVASRFCEPSREVVRLDMLDVLQLHLTYPLQSMSKGSGVQAVVDFMEEYSITQVDFETILDLSKFQGHGDALEGVHSSVKTALTKAYKQREHEHRVKSADLIPMMKLAGQKLPKKRPGLNLNPLEPFEEEDVNEDEELDDEDAGEDDKSSDEDDQGFIHHVNGEKIHQKGTKRASEGATERKHQVKDTIIDVKPVKRKK